ncbi:CIS tube protein [Actinoplanes regularis]|uniref:LysM domain-containing protein n=1 Tax=Actinoplanes regularis TaxID=52697 RepID=A0A239FMI0_9ACTN|nr:LysM peptidoglycan-binding domain-containing protein [Actinoplanes regularis]GIE89670.1 peptidoglycan-binding protein [Actinoplanes regularis]SNS57818.1 hypothetical protein SAMN06264365_118148 [Actinoplanes regularis]
MTAPVKAMLKSETGAEIRFLFNPAELTIGKSNSWQPPGTKGCNAPELRFQAGQSGTLTFSITLDTTDTGTEVTTHTNALLALMQVDVKAAGSDPQSNMARPPWVELHWGKMHWVRAVIERLQIKFTYFASDGTPLRAKVDMSLRQYSDADEPKLQNPTSHTPGVHAVHRLSYGETLDRIAAAHYADPARWRLIAEANRIVDPLALTPGDLLIIPEIPVRRRG